MAFSMLNHRTECCGERKRREEIVRRGGGGRGHTLGPADLPEVGEACGQLVTSVKYSLAGWRQAKTGLRIRLFLHDM